MCPKIGMPLTSRILSKRSTNQANCGATGLVSWRTRITAGYLGESLLSGSFVGGLQVFISGCVGLA